MFNHHFYHIFTVQVYNYCLQSKGGTFFVFWTSNSKTIAYISVFFPQKYVNHRLTKYSSKLLQTPITTSLNIDDYSCYIFLYKTVLQISHLLRKKTCSFCSKHNFLNFSHTTIQARIQHGTQKTNIFLDLEGFFKPDIINTVSKNL